VTIDLDALMDLQRSFLPGLIGMRYTEASKDRLVAELTIRDDLRTVGGALHGGTIMALADTVGATARSSTCRPAPDHDTESKTNFRGRTSASCAPKPRRCIAAAPRWCGRRA
jgi:acyl-coenzyme A thioesterase PaaI-like protein